MLELIGYWSAVTFYSAILLAIPVAIFYTLAGMVVTSAIPDDDDKDKVSRWFYTHEYDNFCNKWILLGGKVSTHCCLFIIPCIISIILWIAVGHCIGDGKEPHHSVQTLIEVVQMWSTFSAPLFTWTGIATMTLIAMRIATKYVYKAVKLSAQVKAHMDDSKIHVVD